MTFSLSIFLLLETSYVKEVWWTISYSFMFWGTYVVSAGELINANILLYNWKISCMKQNSKSWASMGICMDVSFFKWLKWRGEKEEKSNSSITKYTYKMGVGSKGSKVRWWGSALTMQTNTHTTPTNSRTCSLLWKKQAK